MYQRGVLKKMKLWEIFLILSLVSWASGIMIAESHLTTGIILACLGTFGMGYIGGKYG
jgi:hypothetical protein